MLPEPRGFNREVDKERAKRKLGRCRYHTIDNTQLDRLLQSLESETFAEDDVQSESATPVSFGRRIQIPLHSRIQTGKILRLNRICSAEAELVNCLHDLTLQRVLRQSDGGNGAFANASSFTVEDRLAVLRIAQEKINK